MDLPGLYQSMFNPGLEDLVSRGDLINLETLPPAFFLKPTTKVATSLIGKCLIHKVGRHLLAGIIVETEAYFSKGDDASHSARGRTPRNSVMFDNPGACYVYLSYGINYCMNVVTRRAGIGEAVLIRAVRPILGVSEMKKLRGGNQDFSRAREFDLTNGPGKLTAAFGIDLVCNGKNFFEDKLRLLDLDLKIPKSKMSSSPRIGITKSTAYPYRFFVGGSPWVSGKKTGLGN